MRVMSVVPRHSERKINNMTHVPYYSQCGRQLLVRLLLYRRSWSLDGITWVL